MQNVKLCEDTAQIWSGRRAEHMARKRVRKRGRGRGGGRGRGEQGRRSDAIEGGGVRESDSSSQDDDRTASSQRSAKTPVSGSAAGCSESEEVDAASSAGTSNAPATPRRARPPGRLVSEPPSPCSHPPTRSPSPRSPRPHSVGPPSAYSGEHTPPAPIRSGPASTIGSLVDESLGSSEGSDDTVRAMRRSNERRRLRERGWGSGRVSEVSSLESSDSSSSSSSSSSISSNSSSSDSSAGENADDEDENADDEDESAPAVRLVPNVRLPGLAAPSINVRIGAHVHKISWRHTDCRFVVTCGCPGHGRTCMVRRAATSGHKPGHSTTKLFCLFVCSMLLSSSWS